MFLYVGISVMHISYLKHTYKHSIMVKHIHISIDDNEHKQMKKIKQKHNMSWKEMLKQGKKEVER